MVIKWEDAATTVEGPGGTIWTFAKQPDDTAWSFDQDDRIRDGKTPQKFVEWMRRIYERMGIPASKLDQLNWDEDWDKLTDADREWVAAREKYNEKKWKERTERM